MSDALMRTYARLPVAFERGEGAWLTDNKGERYLDALSGIGVCNLGHGHPVITQAIAEQARTLLHTSNLYRIPLQERLAAKLCELADMAAIFFTNSGAEANEAALKLARLYGRKRNIDTPTVMVMDGGFHGRTLATLSATGNRRVQAGFDPLVDGFVRVPYDDLAAVERAGNNNNRIVAVLVEPIQGEAGVVVPDKGYLTGLRRICDERAWLLMLDEVQTGLGRTGAWFAHQRLGAKPDVLTLAKALGNGYPIGACLARGEAAELFEPGSHGSTFGGNPLACRVGLAVLQTLQSERLVQRASRLGERMFAQLQAGLAGRPGVRAVRGLGLMQGIALEWPCTELVYQALDRKLLINVTEQSVLRLLPPLILTDEEAQWITHTVIDLVTSFLSNSGTTRRG
ncbi:aspartate aminotransferase family protein [Nitrococcus mobilis]|uniref:Acetylornithine aminotransferase n=1 Tax=Nitrococcus mobilis Nb-231 TaxID=314278 RepID=A4BSW8_9GAMM|nr:aspartate aminotransferase family protein [Nitrococcus mobilis]EAR21212.1 Acetylornithine and succinylornithine aminotransferase [Nitrococcus mobilis Nb-231]